MPEKSFKEIAESIIRDPECTFCPLKYCEEWIADCVSKKSCSAKILKAFETRPYYCVACDSWVSSLSSAGVCHRCLVFHGDDPKKK